jgi:hypothetical protein
MKGLQILAILGLIVSFYAVYVEIKASDKSGSGPGYVALCDFKEGFSCSAVCFYFIS